MSPVPGGLAVLFLIDGYNLMHAAGLASVGMSAARFERKRHEFLDWLADGVGNRPAVVRVVFDAQRAVSPSAEHTHRGVRVRFAYRQTADDLIEEMLAAEAVPGSVAVVSNDGRVREAARRRGSLVRSCEEFTDWLLDFRPPPAAAVDAPPEKPDGPAAPDEVAELLKAFAAPRPKRG